MAASSQDKEAWIRETAKEILLAKDTSLGAPGAGVFAENARKLATNLYGVDKP